MRESNALPLLVPRHSPKMEYPAQGRYTSSFRSCMTDRICKIQKAQRTQLVIQPPVAPCQVINNSSTDYLRQPPAAGACSAKQNVCYYSSRAWLLQRRKTWSQWCSVVGTRHLHSIPHKPLDLGLALVVGIKVSSPGCGSKITAGKCVGEDCFHTKRLFRVSAGYVPHTI